VLEDDRGRVASLKRHLVGTLDDGDASTCRFNRKADLLENFYHGGHGF
jgi:hypothetical protein